MTSAPLPEPVKLVPDYYSTSYLLDQDRNAAYRQTDKGFERRLGEIDVILHKMVAAAGARPQSNRLMRLAVYLTWGDFAGPHWQEYFAKFPDEALHDWHDYQDLREAADRGEFSNEQA